VRLADGNLQISLSGRLQTFDLSSVQFDGGPPPFAGQEFESPPKAYTGDAALAYFFRSSGTKLRAHFGNAYRAAASYERFGSSFFGGFFSLWGDPRLRPERSIAFDTGIDQWLANSRLRLSATYFYTALQETIVFDFGVIDPVTDPFGRFGGYRNTGGGIARGAEFSATAAPVPSLDFTASYTYVNSTLRTATVPEENFFKALGVSDHTFSLVANQRIGRRVVVTFDLFAAGDYPLRFFNSPRLFNFGGPVKADVIISYTAPIGEGKSVRLYGKAENFFDNSYHENGFRAPGIWGVGGLAFHF
jgi:iron complex outermembrane receptor protein